MIEQTDFESVPRSTYWKRDKTYFKMDWETMYVIKKQIYRDEELKFIELNVDGLKNHRITFCFPKGSHNEGVQRFIKDSIIDFLIENKIITWEETPFDELYGSETYFIEWRK